MPKYKIRVTYEYAVDAVDAEDALATLHIAERIKFSNADGILEIFDEDGKRVLKAQKVEKQRA